MGIYQGVLYNQFKRFTDAKATYCLLCWGGKENHIRKMNTFIKKLIATSVMFLFTAAGFVVLAFSVVLMTVESLVSQVLSQVTALQKHSLTERVSVVKAPSSVKG